MQTIESIKIRVRQNLDDADGVRFTDTLLENAIRQALARLDEKLPLVSSLDQTIISTGREVILTGLVHPMFIIRVEVLPASSESNAKEIKSGYSYTLQGESGLLHFSGECRPRAGETLRVTYAAQNRLSGLDGTGETTMPESASTALANGAAGFACLLRAASLAETYGARAGESARLVEQSKLWMQLSDEALSKLKTCQQFEYPDGFALDRWDWLH